MGSSSRRLGNVAAPVRCDDEERYIEILRGNNPTLLTPIPGLIMDLTQLANLGEFIGGVAVLVTLIYLAIQVGEGSRATRADLDHTLHGSSR